MPLLTTEGTKVIAFDAIALHEIVVAGITGQVAGTDFHSDKSVLDEIARRRARCAGLSADFIIGTENTFEADEVALHYGRPIHYHSGATLLAKVIDDDIAPPHF